MNIKDMNEFLDSARKEPTDIQKRATREASKPWREQRYNADIAFFEARTRRHARYRLLQDIILAPLFIGGAVLVVVSCMELFWRSFGLVHWLTELMFKDPPPNYESFVAGAAAILGTLVFLGVPWYWDRRSYRNY